MNPIMIEGPEYLAIEVARKNEPPTTVPKAIMVSWKADSPFYACHIPFQLGWHF